MTAHPSFRPFNFPRWIADNQHLLKPPVANKQLFDQQTGMVVMIVGGPNQRVDFHDDPVEEFFYQLKGDMLLKIAEGGKIYDVPIREGEVFLLPPHARHSPQRPVPGSIGLVVEGTRREQRYRRLRVVLLRLRRAGPPRRGAGEGHRQGPAAAVPGILCRRDEAHMQVVWRDASRQGAAGRLGRRLSHKSSRCRKALRALA